jgi:hypothetical protein
MIGINFLCEWISYLKSNKLIASFSVNYTNKVVK